MPDYTDFVRKNLHRFKQVEAFLPFNNPTFHNPDFQDAPYRVLIVRLSPFQDIDRSIPHLFLFQEVRRAVPGAYIDMAFFPSQVERELFDQGGIPYLIGVQSLHSVDAFDLVLISNAYTLELINLPYLMVRSNCPLYSSQRGPDWPILILGGSNAMASQAIIRPDGESLVDGIYVGEGEGRVSSLVALLEGSQGDKAERLNQAARQLDGLWVAGSSQPTQKAVHCALDTRFLPLEYPLLNSHEAHTAHLQISYGCPAFCAFCFEGYDRRPYRELALPDLLSAARQIKKAHGNEELNLYSFNANTHQDILELLLALHRTFDRVSLKSQRADILQHTDYLLEAEVEADKRSFTLGIEGISERQRAWLHKSLSTADIMSLLKRLYARSPQPDAVYPPDAVHPHKIREVKLFYILTGHETDNDLAEFRQFLRQLKRMHGIRRNQRSRFGSARNRRLRVIFSFGLLIRMPFTPLQYDRLYLDEREWRPLIGQVKSACETNGFEFRLAFDWPTYCVNQVLALGDRWTNEAIVALACKGYCFDAALPPGYWDELRQWMIAYGHWNDAFLGEKGPDTVFPLSFVQSNVPSEFLYRQYQEAQSGVDSGYCLGDRDRPGNCLGCGACLDEVQRKAIVHHQIHLPDRGRYMAELREVMASKRRLRPAYYLVRLDPSLAGVLPEYLNAFVFAGILALYPELVDPLLSVRENLFTVRPNDRHYPTMSGETIFALKAWDLEAVHRALAEPRDPSPHFQILGPAEGYAPGTFTRLHLDLHLPVGLFPEPRRALEQYLHDVYLPYSLRRERTQPEESHRVSGIGRYRFEVPKKGIKKRVLFDGLFEVKEDGFYASVDVGRKFSLMAFLRAFGQRNLHRHVKARVSGIQWENTLATGGT